MENVWFVFNEILTYIEHFFLSKGSYLHTSHIIIQCIWYNKFFSQPLWWVGGDINLSFYKIKCYSLAGIFKIERNDKSLNPKKIKSDLVLVNQKMVKVFIFYFLKETPVLILNLAGYFTVISKTIEYIGNLKYYIYSNDLFVS